MIDAHFSITTGAVFILVALIASWLVHTACCIVGGRFEDQALHCAAALISIAVLVSVAAVAVLAILCPHVLEMP